MPQQQNPENSRTAGKLLLEYDPYSFQHNQLNNSVSKMQYSVPKAKRWVDPILPTKNANFYDLPSIRSSRATSFGYGNKTNLANKSLNTPSPLAYQIPSTISNQKGISMGVGRALMRNNSVFVDRSNSPGPGQYVVNQSEGHLAFSMSKRHADLSERWVKSIPGPGTYNTLDSTSLDHRSNFNKFENSPCAKFDQAKRLSQYEIRERLLKVPGPNSYQLEPIQSHHRGNSFTKSKRRGISENSSTPGPGSYRQFSQFLH